jgi:integrase
MRPKANHEGRVGDGNVSFPLYRHPKGWRFAWKDVDGKWRYVTKAKWDDAVKVAEKKAREIASGTVDLSTLSRHQLNLVRRVLDSGMSHAEFDQWQIDRRKESPLLSDAVEEFLNVKRQNKGRSSRNVQALKGDLRSLAAFCKEARFSGVKARDIMEWMDTFAEVSARRRKNLRGHVVTFFRWGRGMGYVPDVRTEAEKLEKPIVQKKIPETWTPEEMAKLLAACPESDLPWLVCAGFQGCRSEAELVVDKKGEKSPLDWEDFKWDRGLIIVRPETAKTGHRRVMPIHRVTREWLYPLRKESGPVCRQDKRPWQSKDNKVTVPALTTVLGEKVGGWRRNALRHSFISYRAAQVGLAQAAMESGNSEREAKKSYNDAKSKEEAEAYFSLTPSRILSGLRNLSEPKT